MNNKSVMGTGKKIGIMFFAFVMMMVATPQPLYASDAEIIASGNCTYDGSVKWKLDTEGVLVISGSGYMYDWDGHENEYYKKSVKNVVIEDGITDIADGMFKDCTSLINVSIPDSVTKIGNDDGYSRDGAFEGCISLTDIILPNSITSIARYTFEGCTSLANVNMPDSITNIADGVFRDCTSLANITIPDNVISISDNAFSGCTSLKNIMIPNGVTRIGSHVFFGCDSLTDIIIPDGVTIVREGTFKNCTSLTGVTIPNSVTTIGSNHLDGTFEGCTSLKNITIPTSVTSIDDYAFKDCCSLTDISIPVSITSLRNGILSGCTSLANITIPESVTSIGDYAFKDCTSLTDITIPDSVTSMGEHPFEGCTHLTSIILPQGITTIRTGIFRGDTSVKNITIPDGATSIEKYAFEGCTSLKNITIPDGVTSIGNNAFEGCIALTDISMPESVTDIGEYAFKNCTSLVNVTGLTRTYRYEFYGCTALKEVVIPDGATEVYLTAFTKCSGLISISIPESIQSISLYGMEEIGVPDIGDPNSTVLIVKKPSYAYDWVTDGKFFSHHLRFKVVDQPITITFDSAGGNSISSMSDVVGNSEIELPKPQREGYEFKGWYDENGDYIDKFDTYSRCIIESITLHARWRRNAFTVTFDTDGGSSIPPVTNIAEYSSIKKPKDPVKKGYVFAGWKCVLPKNHGWGEIFSDNTITTDITLKAKWTKNNAKIEKRSSVDIGYTYKLLLISNASVKKVKWTSSNKKILKVTKKKKNSVTVEGLKNKKKATLKAVVTFQDGTKQTVKQTIRVKKKVKRKNTSKGYPKGIMPFDKKVGAFDRGYSDGSYEYLITDSVYFRVKKYRWYLEDKGYHLKTDYYKNPMTPVFVYSKGTVQVKISVMYLDEYENQGFVYIEWNKKKKK